MIKVSAMERAFKNMFILSILLCHLLGYGMAHAEGLSCSVSVIERTKDATKLSVKFENRSKDIVHIFDSKRMPYISVITPSNVLASFALQEPQPNIDYYMIELPPTMEIAAGSTRKLLFDVNKPLLVSSHFSRPQPYNGRLDENMKVDAEVGVIPNSIPKKKAFDLGYNNVLRSQKIIKCKPVKITMPEQL